MGAAKAALFLRENMMGRQNKHAKLEEQAGCGADIVNALRPVYKKHKNRERMLLKNLVAALIYYLPQFPKNDRFVDEDDRPAVNNHTYPRAKAALELLTAEKDSTPSEFAEVHRTRYGVVEFISHRADKTVKHFRASAEDLMTSEEREAAATV